MSLLYSILPRLAAAEAPENICNKWHCHIEVPVSEEPEFCAGFFVSKDHDGRLTRVWASQTMVRLASRVSGESCKSASYFPVTLREADFVSPALKALYAGLKSKPSILDHSGIQDETLRCLKSGTGVRVAFAGGMLDEGDETEVILYIRGCDYKGIGVNATLRTNNKVTMDGFFKDGAVVLTYSPRPYAGMQEAIEEELSKKKPAEDPDKP
jgi:hypothetical protein